NLSTGRRFLNFGKTPLSFTNPNIRSLLKDLLKNKTRRSARGKIKTFLAKVEFSLNKKIESFQ
ncbi:MAG: hypothetical protein ACI4QC_05230, partial [Thermoguttaceae bacterium]